MSERDATMADGVDAEAPDELLGSTIAGRYRLDAKLGEGGMGAVYRAEHVLMQKTVAIKVLHREMTGLADIVRRFAREAIAAGRIEHPNVAAATDFGELEEGSYYLVLEYVPGRSLKEVVSVEGRLPEARVLDIARQVAAALEAAHEEGIVHRDLKPDNVMLVDKGTVSDFVKVLDFGIAKVTSQADGDTKLTRVGAVFGTPQYMSPEQAQGKPVDGRADIYALGLLMDEMLRGGRTFECDEVAGLLVKHMMEAPPSLPSDVTTGMRKLVARLLQKDPDARPPSARAVVQEIDGLVAARGVTAGAPGSALAPKHGVAGGLTDRELWTLVLDRVRGRLRAARPHVVRAAHRLREVGRRRLLGRVPVWSIAAVCAVGALALAWPSASDGGSARAAPKAAAAKAAPAPAVEEPELDDEAPAQAPTDPELLRVVAAARRGSEPALYALSQRDEEERSIEEWMALAEGNLHRRKVAEALDAYERALRFSPRLSEDKTMTTGLRYFATRDSTFDSVLRFAAAHMGPRGADLIFHVWASTSLKTPATQLAWELLESEDVRSRMSSALRVALELRAADSCETTKALLPKVIEVADERALIRLRKLASVDGCGPSGKDDCYACLRGDEQLDRAITQVQMRNAPRFETRRRWR